MTEDGLNKLQQQQLQIMDEIHRVCVENKLVYYLIGGSAIGAVRHNGIIPWDADIDIAMPRVDYEKFMTIAPKQLKNGFTLYHNGNVKHYRNGHATVCRDDTDIVITGDSLNPQIRRFGIYTDILPLDMVPINSYKRNLQKALLTQLKKVRGILLIKNKASDHGLKKFLKRNILIPIFQYAPLSTINKIQHWVCRWENENPCASEICSMLSHYKYDRLCMPKEWFSKPALHEFSGREYYVATDVKSYLTKLFGDYMKLPSPEHQMEMLNLIESATWEENGKIVIV
ncbi:MAG: LicD family protein [Odoribacter sp.]|nr:LicD family protein [Odoribacter sp.]